MRCQFLSCYLTIATIAVTLSRADDFEVPPGFKVEQLYDVPLASQGSWVSLCVADDGKLFASDQYGFLYRITPPPIGQSKGVKVQRLKLMMGKAQGLCWAFGSLYFTGNPVGIADAQDTKG